MWVVDICKVVHLAVPIELGQWDIRIRITDAYLIISHVYTTINNIVL